MINKNLFFTTLLAFGFAVLHPLAAQNISEIETVDFKEVNEIVVEKQKTYGSEQLLIVLDIDNTILTSEVDLGGDVWYHWQRGQLECCQPTEEQKIKECFYEDVIGLLYELGTMRLTDSLIPNYISSWQKDGLHVFALTSRNPRYRTATERELSKQDISFTHSAVQNIDGSPAFFSYKLERDMSYMHGIMMTTGMNKGEMLEHLLSRTAQSYRAIIFVDDSEKNIVNMKASYEDDSNIDLTLIHYDKIVADRIEENGGPIVTKKQAKKMTDDWNKLQNTLLEIFPGRSVENGCVSPN